MTERTNLRQLVRDGIITPDQADRISTYKYRRPAWWSRAIGWILGTLIATTAILLPVALIVFLLRVIFG